MKKTMFAVSAIALSLMSASVFAGPAEKSEAAQEKFVSYSFYGVAVPADNAKNIKYTDLQKIKDQKAMAAYLKDITKSENAKLITSGGGMDLSGKDLALSVNKEIPYTKSVTMKTDAADKTLTQTVTMKQDVFNEGVNLLMNSKEDNGFIRTKMNLNTNTLLLITKGDVKEGTPDSLDTHSVKIDTSFIVKPNQVVKFDSPVYEREGKEYKDIYFIQQSLGTTAVKG